MTFAATILTLYPEMFPGHYSRPDVLELSMNTRTKDAASWQEVICEH